MMEQDTRSNLLTLISKQMKRQDQCYVTFRDALYYLKIFFLALPVVCSCGESLCLCMTTGVAC